MKANGESSIIPGKEDRLVVSPDLSSQVTYVYCISRHDIAAAQDAVLTARTASGVGGRRVQTRQRPGGKFVELTIHLKGVPEKVADAAKILIDLMPAECLSGE